MAVGSSGSANITRLDRPSDRHRTGRRISRWVGCSAPRLPPPDSCVAAPFAARDPISVIGTFASAPALDRRTIADPDLLRYRDRACMRILQRCDVATTAQLTTLVNRRRQTAQERQSALYNLGYLDRAILPPTTRGGSPLAFRVSPKGRRRMRYASLHPIPFRHPAPALAQRRGDRCAASSARRAATDSRLVQRWLPESMAAGLLPLTASTPTAWSRCSRQPRGRPSSASRSTRRPSMLVARLAAHCERWALIGDRTAATAPVRRAADDRFVAQARVLHPGLPEEEIAKRASSLRSAHTIRAARVRWRGQTAARAAETTSAREEEAGQPEASRRSSVDR